MRYPLVQRLLNQGLSHLAMRISGFPRVDLKRRIKIVKCPAFSRILVTLVMPCGAAACVGVAAGGCATATAGACAGAAAGDWACKGIGAMEEKKENKK